MCGVIGIYSQSDVSKKLFYGLNSLQHRGQEASGICVFDGKNMVLDKGMGLVYDNFDDESFIKLKGNIGIGHVRYATAGGSYEYNSQPLLAFSKNREFALAHNGNLVNHKSIRRELEDEGMLFQTAIDTEVILSLVAKYYTGDIIEAVKKTMSRIKGAYSVVMLFEDKLVAFRDPYGYRPLLIGRAKNGEVIIASENAPLEIIGTDAIRDVEPSEIIVVDKKGIHSEFFEKEKRQHCIFEYVYFARTDATLDGVNSYNFRRRCGEILSKEAPVDADLVLAVPDSGTPGAMGYAQKSGIPFAEGLVKNRYMGRTFIKPTPEERELSVKLKLNPLETVLRGKRVILVDDSIVRGTTSKNLIMRMKKAGAKEVHMRIVSPPVKYPCFYGIDTPSRKKLIAANYSVEEMRERIGADSLAFISMKGMLDATLMKEDVFCKACFNGDYAVEPKELVEDEK
ncbi:MAG: amidophosphoribosyltransferase [Peptoniphilus sp.]|uniref:amidophosphoribosyltransferase n=1 Tax=Peptoniphilus sp. TaxID=1971214 RepID=UPI0025E73BC8|nr:amidophosphoribosyltransferase [Peptoniphilus sp.]MCI5642795.1 amidophosphoribosyltransferase [Peptoniphilus sp.]MDD7351986.1 amidophosphoribosyltransferase [Peptoniphilaceae bacterium]MDY3902495.1 amidophosphoribosyltransferase [Peptoniphilus sp.]